MRNLEKRKRYEKVMAQPNKWGSGITSHILRIAYRHFERKSIVSLGLLLKKNLEFSGVFVSSEIRPIG